MHLGQIDLAQYQDVRLASVEGKRIVVKEITGSNFDGVVTQKELTVKQVCEKSLRHSYYSYCLQ